MPSRQIFPFFPCGCLFAAVLLFPAAAPAQPPAAAPGAPAQAHRLGQELPIWSVGFFALLLLGIALLPLLRFSRHWWESNRNRLIFSLALALPFALYLTVAHGQGGLHAVVHSLVEEYLPFIVLLAALFVISGGIYIKGSLAGTPLANTGFLAIGAVLANLIGTTGASMVLIRPVLRANQTRRRKVHIIIFFIFIVSNCGGLLTPLGDPPLFLGFLKGVPFEWTLVHLWREWIAVNALLLILFNMVDQRMLAKEEMERPGAQLEEAIPHVPLGIEGGRNFLFLGGIVLVIIAKGQGWGFADGRWPTGVQEGLMAGLGLLAYWLTSPAIRTANGFTFGPIIEVAVLFLGIFTTMVAPLLILNERGAALPIRSPAHFFWATGILSSLLDNAPTYLTFAATAAGKLGVAADNGPYLARLLALPGDGGAQALALLQAISCGAVFMGANSYIGNGPNFMVKAIAEENGVKMPSFFGYMVWSVGILIPTFIAVTFLFFA